MKTIMFIMPNKGYSGAEAVVINIINSLKDKYNFIYVSEEGTISKYLEKFDIKHVKTNKKLDRKEIKDIIKKYNPDIIHATDFRASVIVSTISTKIPIISHVHNNPPWLKGINKNSISYLVATRKFKKILTVSDSIEKEYIFSKYIKTKIVNISNPLSRESILEKVQDKSYEKIYDICFVGRTCEQKDPLRFVDIIKKVAENKKNIKTVIVGDGSLYERTKNYIVENGLENNIEMTGFINNPLEIMKESKIFCLTSKWEGFGLVAFEALTLGLPSLTTSVGGLVNIVDNECGSLCNTNEEFVNNIMLLLENDSEYNKKSKKAIEKSLKLENIDEYMKKMDEIYKLVLE